ncbi:MAG: S1 RNA-binding domain-containing protein [Chloroflexi bacterium]|nr:S1 RNA-binding domain-containing protein [Chloroflexota bacterium]
MNDTSSLASLHVGEERTATVKAIELYGAFVDIGIGSDALLHISQLGKPNVRNVGDIVKIGDSLKVYVLKVDTENKRVKPSRWSSPRRSTGKRSKKARPTTVKSCASRATAPLSILAQSVRAWPTSASWPRVLSSRPRTS